MWVGSKIHVSTLGNVTAAQRTRFHNVMVTLPIKAQTTNWAGCRRSETKQMTKNQQKNYREKYTKK